MTAIPVKDAVHVCGREVSLGHGSARVEHRLTINSCQQLILAVSRQLAACTYTKYSHATEDLDPMTALRRRNIEARAGTTLLWVKKTLCSRLLESNSRPRLY